MAEERKPIFKGIIGNGEYEAVIVKVEEMPPTDRGVAAKVLFLIDNIVVNGTSYVYFVNGFFDKNYKSNTKTAKLVSAIGLESTGILQTKSGMVGKKCKLYVEAGPVKTNKFGQPVQYMQIKAINPINRVVPNPVSVSAPAQQPSFATPVQQPQAPVQQAPSFAQPVVLPNNVVNPSFPHVAPSFTVPQAVPQQTQPTFAQPAQVPVIPTQVPQQQPIPTQVPTQPVISAAPQAVPQPKPQAVPRPEPVVAPAPVQQAEQPLPTYTQDDLDF